MAKSENRIHSSAESAITALTLPVATDLPGFSETLIGVEHSAFDVCSAPLRELEYFAAKHQLSVRCFQASLQSFVAKEQFDLVFVHNTLCFLEVQEAANALGRLRDAVDPAGWLACGMRYEMGDLAFGGAAAAGIAGELRHMVDTTYASRPDLAALVAPHIEPYSEGKMRANLPCYRPEDFLRAVESCALVRVDGYTDTQTPPAVSSSAPEHSSIRADVHLLRHA